MRQAEKRYRRLTGKDKKTPPTLLEEVLTAKGIKDDPKDWVVILGDTLFEQGAGYKIRINGAPPKNKWDHTQAIAIHKRNLKHWLDDRSAKLFWRMGIRIPRGARAGVGEVELHGHLAEIAYSEVREMSPNPEVGRALTDGELDEIYNGGKPLFADESRAADSEPEDPPQDDGKPAPSSSDPEGVE